MRAVARTVVPSVPRGCEVASPPPSPLARQADSDIPPCLPEPESVLDESSQRALLALFELLDRWELEENNDEE